MPSSNASLDIATKPNTDFMQQPCCFKFYTKKGKTYKSSKDGLITSVL